MSIQIKFFNFIKDEYEYIGDGYFKEVWEGMCFVLFQYFYSKWMVGKVVLDGFQVQYVFFII